MDVPQPFLSLVSALLACLLCGVVFCIAKHALLYSSETRLRRERGANWARAAKMLEQRNSYLALAQVMQLFIVVAAAWISVAIVKGLPAALDMKAQHSPAIWLTLLGMTVLVMLLSTFVLFPGRQIGSRYPEQSLRWLAPVLLFTHSIFGPLVFVLERSSRGIFQLLGVPSGSADAFGETRREFSLVFSGDGSAEDEKQREEEKMLQGVVEFGETIAREVMTPRTDLVSVPADASLDDVLSLAESSGYSRLPVTGKNIDDVVGVLLIKDVLRFVTQARSERESFSVPEVMREAHFIPGTMPVRELLRSFKRRKLHQAIVLDEHGGVDGLVTLEDVIEEIVGDIFDESDSASVDVTELPDGSLLVSGGMLVADVNQGFSLHIPEGDYDTIAGFIFTSLGRVPKEGDALVVHGDEVLPALPSNGVRPHTSGSESEEADQEGSTHLLDDIHISVQRVRKNRIERVKIETVSRSSYSRESQPLAAASKTASN